MRPLQQQSWILSEPTPLIEFTSTLLNAFEVQTGPVERFSRSWFDTFDWRLFRKKRVLIRENSQWNLLDFKGNIQESLLSRQKIFHYSWDFPESPLQRALQAPLNVRALTKLVTEEVESTEIQILNREQKIVVFLKLQQSTSDQSEKILSSVQLLEVRGYPGKFKKSVDFIRHLDCQELNSPADTLHLLLKDSSRFPLDYASAYNVPLDAKMSSIDASTRIYRSLLANMRANEEGVIFDRDTEFLHDFRVALRRTRSGLALIKNVLSPEVLTRFKKEFRSIGKITGPIRDLDVYLLNTKAYKSGLPVQLQEGLNYFFEDIAVKRKEEHRKLLRFLNSSQYATILSDWEKSLDQEVHATRSKNAEVAIGILAKKIIHKHFHHVLDDGKKIHPHTPDSELHRLRIECKKLRYSLEFFSSLYDQRQMKRFIGQLKKLQNNLGDFNDISIQQEMLANYLSGIRPGSKKMLQLSASIGGLMADLARQHSQVRAHFEDTFFQFSCEDNLNLYNQMFA